MIKNKAKVLHLKEKGLSQSQISRKLGISRQRVHQLVTGYSSVAGSQKKLCDEVVKNLYQAFRKVTKDGEYLAKGWDDYEWWMVYWAPLMVSVRKSFKQKPPYHLEI